MISSKYENLIYPEPLQKRWFVEGVGKFSKEEGTQYLGSEFTFAYNLITEPLYMKNLICMISTNTLFSSGEIR
jgi:hypothetical protein